MAPDIADPALAPDNHHSSSSSTTSSSSIQKRMVSSSRENNLVSNDDNNNLIEPKQNLHSEEFRPQIRWPDFFAQLFLHVGFLIGLWLVITLQTKFYTVLWSKIILALAFKSFQLIWFTLKFSALALVWASGIGITAGAHRLWSHKSYKAKWPLRILLMFLFTICGQVCFRQCQIFFGSSKS